MKEFTNSFLQADAVMAKFDENGDGKLDYEVKKTCTFYIYRSSKLFFGARKARRRSDE